MAPVTSEDPQKSIFFFVSLAKGFLANIFCLEFCQGGLWPLVWAAGFCLDESLKCAFSNVSSNWLPTRMHSHTGHICLAFLHCVFSNVSSNCMPTRLYSHIDYICLAFLHYVFSNVSSDCLPGMMLSHTDCICLTFLHVSSNVFSNCVWLCMTLLQCAFSNDS